MHLKESVTLLCAHGLSWPSLELTPSLSPPSQLRQGWWRSQEQAHSRLGRHPLGGRLRSQGRRSRRGSPREAPPQERQPHKRYHWRRWRAGRPLVVIAWPGPLVVDRWSRTFLVDWRSRPRLPPAGPGPFFPRSGRLFGLQARTLLPPERGSRNRHPHLAFGPLWICRSGRRPSLLSTSAQQERNSLVFSTLAAL